VWQALYEELRDRNFVVVAVALDKSAEDARPWIEKAAPTYPVLIDTQHVLPDLYNIVNVPTALWIDERGRIVRPNDVVFGSDTFKHITNLESAKPLAAVRAWVRARPPASRRPRRARSRRCRRRWTSRRASSSGWRSGWRGTAGATRPSVTS